MLAKKEDKTYQGWKNYETWTVNLWLSDEIIELAKKNKETYELAEVIRNYMEERLPDLGASLAADLLNAAVSEVDWYEIAESILTESPPSLNNN